MSKKKINNTEKRILKTKEEYEEYGLVTKTLGGGNFKIKLNLQNKEVIGKVRGKLKKGSQKKENWVEVDSIVLVSYRDFQDAKVDILYVYTHEEAKTLRKTGEIIFEDNTKEETGKEHNEDDCVFDFSEI